MSRAPSATDMRGFRWRLAPLERKLGSEVLAARLLLTRLRGDEDALQRAMESMHEEAARQLEFASAAAHRDFDAGIRARALDYLVHLGQAIDRRQEELSALRARIGAAREHSLRLQTQLACVDKLRETAETAYATAQSRKLAKESDLMWLVARARRGEA